MKTKQKLAKRDDLIKGKKKTKQKLAKRDDLIKGKKKTKQKLVKIDDLIKAKLIKGKELIIIGTDKKKYKFTFIKYIEKYKEKYKFKYKEIIYNRISDIVKLLRGNNMSQWDIIFANKGISLNDLRKKLIEKEGTKFKNRTIHLSKLIKLDPNYDKIIIDKWIDTKLVDGYVFKNLFK